MSDYLWDKKGDADAEVARLEALLGAFKHAPRALELPAAAAPPGPRPPRLLPFVPRLRASRLFAPAALAAAAALLVASVLAASAFLRARVAGEGERAARESSARPEERAPKDERTAPREVEQAMLEPPPPAGGVEDRHKVDSVAVGNLPNVVRQKKAVQPAFVLRRQQKGLTAEAVTDGAGVGEGLTLEAMRAEGGASALVESTRLLTKEQLVYALRLTGAKLRDVRVKAQGVEAETRP